MHSWLRGRRLMGAMDAVMREWGRLLGLHEREVYIVMILEAYGPACCAEIGYEMGRQRQQVQRNLLDLEVRNVVEPAVVAEDFTVHSWTLSSWGRRVAEVLNHFVRLWELQLATVCDLDVLQRALEVAHSSLVNCTRDPRGWKYGLAEPRLGIKGDKLTLAALEALDGLRQELKTLAPNHAAKSRAAARAKYAQERAEREEREASQLWERLWS